MGANNPILFIHDVGAGGLSNAIPELVHDINMGGKFELRDIDNAGCSSRSILPSFSALICFLIVNRLWLCPLAHLAAMFIFASWSTKKRHANLSSA